jgi:ATP-binding cassette, subfamily B (MDR/TAP), member 1
MTILFGNLTQDFLDFSTAIQNLNPNDPQSTAKVDEAAKRFRHVAAKDASYLTYISEWLFILVISSWIRI